MLTSRYLVTILAFVFVPISLASSIFGMNVQEINATGHGIRSFVLTALLMLLSSLIAWLAWRTWRNMRQIAYAGGHLILYIRRIWSWQKSVAVLTGLHSLNRNNIDDERLR